METLPESEDPLGLFVANRIEVWSPQMVTVRPRPSPQKFEMSHHPAAD
jgi:hypothetical protein